jgi:hypothetical protein
MSARTIPNSLRGVSQQALQSVKGLLPFNTPTANSNMTPLPTDRTTEEMLLDDLCVVGTGISHTQKEMLSEHAPSSASSSSLSSSQVHQHNNSYRQYQQQPKQRWAGPSGQRGSAFNVHAGRSAASASAAAFQGHEVLGLNGSKLGSQDAPGSMMRAGLRGNSVGDAASGTLPTPMGFRTLSPAFDIWTMGTSPTSRGSSRNMVFSPTSMLTGLEPFSPTTIREVDDLDRDF